MWIKRFVHLHCEYAKLSSDSFRATALGTVATASITPDLELNAKSYMIYGYKDIPTESKFTYLFNTQISTRYVVSLWQFAHPNPRQHPVADLELFFSQPIDSYFWPNIYQIMVEEFRNFQFSTDLIMKPIKKAYLQFCRILHQEILSPVRFPDCTIIVSA